jgi:preprotein translocase subunit SecD
MNRYPLWKYLIVLIVVVVGVIYALPNLYGEDPALQIATNKGQAPAEAVQARILEVLEEADIAVKSAQVQEDNYLVRLQDEGAQLRAAALVKEALDRSYVVALNLAPTTPEWLRGLNAQPMYLGLDLRGGVHFLMEVDLEAAIKQAIDRYVNEFRTLMREQRIRYGAVEAAGNSVVVRFDQVQEREQAVRELRQAYPELQFQQEERDGQFWLSARLTEERLREIQQFAVQQNVTTLRNRVNELGVAEPVIQRQGANRIVVQLPGVQDTARAKEILGATATLEFRMMDEASLGGDLQPGSRIPVGTELFPRREGGYVLLKRDVILTGDYITDASSNIDTQTGQPQVNIRLNSAGGQIMNRETRDNVGKFMAVVFIENKVETRVVDGEQQKIRTRTQEVINTARIQEALGASFRITGLDSTNEARDLALLLRAGSLAAPLEIIEERTVGPSLGKANIEQGFFAALIGLLVVAVFMVVYYRVFGLVAVIALTINVILLIAVLSMLQATLTLPGIAGIALTIGMAVDANVLIFQRIREELAARVSPQAAINTGYSKALSAIADGNLTTLIAALALFAFGTGPVRGFAVTLSIGIVTSMFTAIMVSRAIVNLTYGGRRVGKLHI